MCQEVSGITTKSTAEMRLDTVGTAFSGTITPSAICNVVNGSPLVISGFNYQVQNRTQFDNYFKFYRASINGRLVGDVNILDAQERNTQFQNTLLTIQEKFVIDAQTGLALNVNDTEIVSLTFFVEGFKFG